MEKTTTTTRRCYKPLNAQSEIVKVLEFDKQMPVDPQMSQEEEQQLTH